MTTFLIISYIWLWVMLGLWGCQIVQKYMNIRLWGFIAILLFMPLVLPAIISEYIEFNPIIFRKKN